MPHEHCVVGELNTRGPCRSQWQEILGTPDRLAYAAEKLLQIGVALNEVNVIGIDHQQVGRGVMKKEVLIGLDHFFNVVVTHGGLTGQVFLA